MEHQTNRAEAKRLAQATKISKIKLSCNHYQQLADEAFSSEELQQGITQLKKIKTLLSKVSPLPNDLQQIMIECQGLIDKTQNTINDSKEETGSKRLEDEFDKLEEQDQVWQKKQLYDQ